MQRLTRACDLVERLVTIAGVLLFALMIVVVFYEVVMRYVFNAPTFWTEATARTAMVWLVLLGLARGLRNLDNIRVDFLVDQVPPPLQRVAGVLRLAIVFAFASVMVVYGGKLALDNREQIATGTDISVMWVYLSVPTSGLLLLLFAIELVARRDLRPF